MVSRLGIVLNSHGKIPDVIIYDDAKEWLFLIEAVTSHGPINDKRYDELSELFSTSEVGLVYNYCFHESSNDE